MKKSLPILMLVTIAAIACFQLYWLMENYRKEKKNLEFRTNIAFRETVKKLQAKKLNLDKIFTDTISNVQIEVVHGEHPGPEELAGVLNDVSVKVRDSVIRVKRLPESPDILYRKMDATMGISSTHPAGKMILVNESHSRSGKDSGLELNYKHRGKPGEIVRFLYSLDSLQDSLRITEIDSACKIAFKKEKLTVPFTILRRDSVGQIDKFPPEDPQPVNTFTVGFAHPATYEIHLGNSFIYLIKKLASPILFSLFLVGVTVLSFVLLYRNLQRQRKLAEIKNEFISNITHELKTPIATVGVAIEALRNFNAINDPRRTKEYLDISQNELHRLSLLVDKVLKLSMFEKKEIELKYEPLNLKDIVDEVVSSMKLQIEKHHATVSVNTEGDTSLQGDRLHLLSVIFNLLDNALKYGNGNTAIKFDIKEMENEVELSVADNGIGISPEYKDKVFEKFFRVPSGDKHNTKGYGLGLSYVAHVVEKHKGKIEVESQQGLGTNFIITLPKNI